MYCLWQTPLTAFFFGRKSFPVPLIAQANGNAAEWSREITCDYSEMFRNRPGFTKPEMNPETCKLEPMSKLWISEIELLKCHCSAPHSTEASGKTDPVLSQRRAPAQGRPSARGLSGKKLTSDSLPKHGFPWKQHIWAPSCDVCWCSDLLSNKLATQNPVLLSPDFSLFIFTPLTMAKRVRLQSCSDSI